MTLLCCCQDSTILHVYWILPHSTSFSPPSLHPFALHWIFPITITMLVFLHLKQTKTNKLLLTPFLASASFFFHFFFQKSCLDLLAPSPPPLSSLEFTLIRLLLLIFHPNHSHQGFHS